METYGTSTNAIAWENFGYMEEANGRTSPLIVVYSQSEEVRLLLNAFLNIWNFRVEEAVSELSLIRIAEQKNPALVLFDLSRMFEEDLELLRRLRTSQSFVKTPIFVLSGHARTENLITALASGADEYFIKPINFERLETSVKKYSCQTDGTDRNLRGWQ